MTPWLAPAAVAVIAAAVAPAAPAPIAWRQWEPGARSTTLAVGEHQILLVELDLDRFRADIVVGEGWPPRVATAVEARARASAVAVVNGGFFDERRASLGLRIASGKVRVGLRPRVDWGVLCVRDRRARIIHGRDYRPDPAITAAIQVGPRLIVDGVPLKLKPQVARRTAVALDKEGRLLTLVVVDRAIEAGILAAQLATVGVHSALLLDGGPSTQLALELGKPHGERIEVPGLYPVPDLLAVIRR